MKKKLILGFIALATAAALAGCGVEQTATEITVEAGEELQVHANDFLDVDESKAADVVIDAEGVDTTKVGEYELTATYGKDTYTVKVIVVDTTAPVVELASNEVTVEAMAEFVPADIVTVTDASEYTVTVVGYEDVTQKAGEAADADTEVDAATSDVSLDGLVSDVPTDDGTYRTVISVKDAYENESFVAVYVTVDAQDEEAEDEKDSEKKDTSSNKKDTSTKKDTSSNTASSNTSNSGSGTNAGSNSSSGSSGNNATNNASGSAESTPEEESPSVDEEPSGMTPTQEKAYEVGYYKVFVAPNTGSYCVMVHDGRSEIDYAQQLIDEYLAERGLRAIGGGGANMPGGNGWMYVVEADEVAPLQ